MLLCRRILFKLEFGPFCRFATARRNIATKSALKQDVTGHPTKPSKSVLLERLFALSEHSTNAPKQMRKMREKVSDLQAYKHLRILDRPSLAGLPMPSYLNLLAQSSKLRLGETSSQLVEDLLECGPESERVPTVLAVMSSHALPLLPPRTILLLLQCLDSTPRKLRQLALPDVAVLVHTFAEAPDDPVDMSLLELIFPLVLTNLKNLPQPQGDAVLTYKPPDIIHATFTFLDKLLHLSQEQRALELFQILADSGNIPPEAVQTIPGFDGFEAIVRSSLVRASTHWHWRPLAQRFLSPLLELPSSGLPTVELAIETVYACLDNPSVDDLRACRVLISQIHPFSPVPDAIIREFYNAAEEVNARREAHALYAFTRSKDAVKTHWYTCPRASSLAWLLRYLLQSNSYLARNLAQDILDANLSLPVESRAKIVGGLASQGHAILARSLWSRYAVGKNRESFIQDPSLMIRMVSLFHHLAKREDAILEQRANSREFFLDNDAIRERSKDYKEFLDFVFSEFIRAHAPIFDSSHPIITSLARAHFIMGQFIKGFETIKILLDRKEMPDLYDVNVTLTVMAEHDPRTAAQIVERMIEKGLQPDHITFGTVMHHALNHGDVELVDEMVQRVRALENTHLSYKSIVSLVRGSISQSNVWDHNDLTTQSKLQSAFTIIQAVGRSTVVASPHLGKFLVFACLRAEDPTMAFKFWDYLLRDSADWHDREQLFMRRLIIDRVERHIAEGWLKNTHGRTMIAQLELEWEVFTKI